MINFKIASPIFLESFWFCKTDSTDLRVGKDDGWDERVGECGLRKLRGPEKSVGELSTSCYGDFLHVRYSSVSLYPSKGKKQYIPGVSSI